MSLAAFLLDRFDEDMGGGPRARAFVQSARRMVEYYGRDAYFNSENPRDELAYRWLCILAETWSDHPDYYEGWRP